MLGRYFTWDEMTRSTTARELGIDNAVRDCDHRLALVLLVRDVLDPLRMALDTPVHVTSGYRTAELNAAIGGSSTSQHMRGQAADIRVPGMPARDLADAIHLAGLPYDQLIWYHDDRGGHVHVSIAVGREPRGEYLYAPPQGGYLEWPDWPEADHHG
jgi:Uncharacterized protein conserved in bacteria